MASNRGTQGSHKPSRIPLFHSTHSKPHVRPVHRQDHRPSRIPSPRPRGSSPQHSPTLSDGSKYSPKVESRTTDSRHQLQTAHSAESEIEQNNEFESQDGTPGGERMSVDTASGSHADWVLSPAPQVIPGPLKTAEQHTTPSSVGQWLSTASADLCPHQGSSAIVEHSMVTGVKEGQELTVASNPVRLSDREGSVHSSDSDPVLSEAHSSQSTDSLPSQKSLPSSLMLTGRPHIPVLPPAMGRVREQLQNEASTISLPQLDSSTTATKKYRHTDTSPTSSSLHRPRSMPQLASAAAQALTSQLHLVQVEKDAFERQLKQARETITTLETREQRSKEHILRVDSKMAELQKTLSEQQREEAKLKESHRMELLGLQQGLREELERERERLLSQIRELAMINSRSLEKTSQDTSDHNSEEATDEILVRNEKTYLMEIEALKGELSAMQELLEESEQLQDSMASTRGELEGQVKQVMSESEGLKQELRNQTDHNEVVVAALSKAEQRISQLEAEKAQAVAECEKRLLAESIKLQVQHDETVRKLQLGLNHSKATIKAQEKIQSISGEEEFAWSEENPGSDGKFTRVQMKDQDTHAEEMLVITEALEKEGFGPSQATRDEVVRHLWWKKEHIREELQITRQKLKETIGADQYKALQECQDCVASLEQDLATVKKTAEDKDNESTVLHEACEKKMGELLQEHQEHCSSLNQRELALVSENKELKRMTTRMKEEENKNISLLAESEADLSSQRRSYAELENILSVAKHQNSLLQTQLNSLRTVADSREEELTLAIHSYEDMKEKLAVSDSHLCQSREEVESLLAKVLELTGELSVSQQHLSHVTVQRDSLLEQLETSGSQLSTTEAQLNSERTNANKLQSMVERLSEDLQETSRELQRLCSQRETLEEEASFLKSDLLTAQQKNTLIEIDLLAVQDDYNSSQDALFQASSLNADLKEKLSSTLKEFQHLREVTDERQSLLQQHLEEAATTIEGQKQTISEFRAATELLHTEKEELVRRTFDLEAENSKHRMEVSQSEQDLAASQEECHTLQARLDSVEKEQDFLKCALEKAQEELAQKTASLSTAQNSVSSVNVAFTQLKEKFSTNVEELEKVKGDLCDTESQRSTLLQEKEKAVLELQELRKCLQEKMVELDTKNSEHRLAISQSDQRLTDSQRECQSLQERVVAMENTCTSLRAELQEVREELKLKSEGLTAAEESTSSMSVTLAQLREEISANEKELEAARKSLCAVSSERDGLLQEKEEMLTAMEQMRTSLNDTTADLASTQRTLRERDEDISRFEAEKAAVAKQLQDGQRDYQKLSGEKIKVEKDLHIKTTELQVEMERLLKAQEEVAERGLELRSAQSQLLELTTALNSERERAGVLEQQLASASAYTSTLESEVHTCKSELTDYETKVTRLEDKCEELKISLETEVRQRESVESHNEELRQCQSRNQQQIHDLTEKAKVEAMHSQHLKEEVKLYKQEVVALRQQLQLLKEKSTSSFREIQSSSQEQSSNLQHRIWQLSDELKEAQVSNLKLQEEMMKAAVTMEELNAHMAESKLSSADLQTQLKKESSAVKIQKQRVEVLLKRERQLEEDLVHERSVQAELRSHAAEEKNQLATLSLEVRELQATLLKERSDAEKLKREIKSLKDSVSYAQEELRASRKSYSDLVAKSKSDRLEVKKAHQNEQRELKDQLRNMRESLESLQSQYVRSQGEVVRLAAISKAYSEELGRMTERLGESEGTLVAFKADYQILEARNRSLLEQVHQARADQWEKDKLKNDIQHYKKKTAAKSRSDMQRVVAEVTTHMEEQYAAHQYIEKLRAENESTLMVTKDREIKHLRCELDLQRREMQQDTQQLESLELDTQHHHTHKRDQERSRNRFQSHLERVNDALSKSAPPLLHSSSQTP